jgi:hypothetical protein
MGTVSSPGFVAVVGKVQVKMQSAKGKMQK